MVIAAGLLTSPGTNPFHQLEEEDVVGADLVSFMSFTILPANTNS